MPLAVAKAEQIGNVEICQAASPGTMNNLSFGQARFQQYETICGGTGAGIRSGPAGFGDRGIVVATSVQSHISNSRLTDPEILESRLPVRLQQFAIRAGSGGAGRFGGGYGPLAGAPLCP